MKIVLLPFGLPVVVDRFLFLCLAIAEKGEVSRSDGGVENLSVTVSLNPLAYGTPPYIPLAGNTGGEFNCNFLAFTGSAEEAPPRLRRSPYIPLVENTGGEFKCNSLAFAGSAEEETLRHCLRHSSIFSCRKHRGRGEFSFTSPAQELFRVKFF
ncbi:hypothetical protein NW211_06985 [Barnesiella sp. ET7]|uniref:hypothetical protein n=1 Tax=Barnesiella sp. ET7 TaxID=2972460 RepID=UPI0021AC5431|nr:hypothetical protein [Barnesiella sp. ET7]MCR8911741.1 hypothetical protein [Barnesiella sp. ET7]